MEIKKVKAIEIKPNDLILNDVSSGQEIHEVDGVMLSQTSVDIIFKKQIQSCINGLCLKPDTIVYRIEC